MATATEDVQLAEKTLSNLIMVAISYNDEITPNGRCIAITLALAILVSPEKVTIEDATFGTEIIFGRIKIDFSRSNAAAPFMQTNSFFAKEHGKPRWTTYVDLAQTYSDRRQDVEARKLLHRYLSLADDPVSKAALLGLAWAKLQKKAITESYRIDTSTDTSGHWLECEELGLSVQIDRDEIIRAVYPGLGNFYKTDNRQVNGITPTRMS